MPEAREPDLRPHTAHKVHAYSVLRIQRQVHVRIGERPRRRAPTTTGAGTRRMNRRDDIIYSLVVIRPYMSSLLATCLLWLGRKLCQAHSPKIKKAINILLHFRNCRHVRRAGLVGPLATVSYLPCGRSSLNQGSFPVDSGPIFEETMAGIPHGGPTLSYPPCPRP